MCEQTTKYGHRFVSKYLRKLWIFIPDFTSKNPGTKFNSSLNIQFLSSVVIEVPDKPGMSLFSKERNRRGSVRDSK